MVIALLAVIGLFVGIVLDVLIGRLAWPTVIAEPVAEPQPDPEVGTTPVLATETGSLVVASGHSHWRRRVAVIAVPSAFFALAALRYDEPGDLAIVTAYVSVLLVCAGTDLISYRVPNVVTYPAIVGAIVIGALMPDADFWEVLAGGALAGGV